MSKNAFNEAPASWGPPPLTSRPEGLLDSLGIQSGGEYPKTLNADLQPVYELGPWYREYNQKFRSASSAPGLVAVTSTFDTGISVPDGEIWIVNRIGCEIVCNRTASNSTAYFQLLRTNNANGTELTVSAPTPIETTNVVTAAGSRVYLGLDYPPLLLRPTVKLRVMYGSNRTGDPITVSACNISLGVTVCRI